MILFSLLIGICGISCQILKYPFTQLNNLHLLSFDPMYFEVDAPMHTNYEIRISFPASYPVDFTLDKLISMTNSKRFVRVSAKLESVPRYPLEPIFPVPFNIGICAL